MGKLNYCHSINPVVLTTNKFDLKGNIGAETNSLVKIRIVNKIKPFFLQFQCPHLLALHLCGAHNRIHTNKVSDDALSLKLELLFIIS